MPKVIDGSIGPIGSIVSSMLTEAQYQGLYGTGWILMDGRSCAGSAYSAVTGATTVPDARGMVLRGKNNGRSDGSQNPDGDSVLGAFQDHQVTSHRHGGPGVSGINPADGRPTIAGHGVPTNETNRVYWGDYTGGNETRMRNITVNHFIRIN